MKFTACFIYFLSVLLTAESGGAQLPRLVKDLNVTPGNDSISFPENISVAGPNLFFTRFDRTHGAEFWKCDLASKETVLLKDIWPGSGSSSSFSHQPSLPSVMDKVTLGSVLFFTANDGIHGYELWRSDGTQTGTFMFKDIIEGAESSFPERFTVMGGKIYFIAPNTAHGTELWKSDGTLQGTGVVKEILSGVSRETGSYLGLLTPVGNHLFFRSYENSNAKLWVTDGTETGTILLVQGSPERVIRPNQVVALGNKVLFVNEDPVHGEEIWRTDGTVEGTALVTELVPGNGDAGIILLMATADQLYFLAVTPEYGWALWKTDGTAEGTALVKDTDPGQNSYDWFDIHVNGQIGQAGDVVCFALDNVLTGTELWRTDGSSTGTFLLKDIRPGSRSSEPLSFTTIGDHMFFRANDGTSGYELWRTDGTAAGTVMVKDIDPGSNSSSPQDFLVSGGNLYFRANDKEIWRSDGSAAGTVRVVESITGTDSSYPSQLVAAGQTLYFSNYGNLGNLWKSDGSSAGTVKMKDIVPESKPVALGNSVYFPAYSEEKGIELWKSNGTAAGTGMLKDLNAGPEHSQPQELTAVGNQLFFSAETAAAGWELWKSDGTVAGTSMVKDLNPGLQSSVPSGFVKKGEAVFFAALGAEGYGLWKSDSTAAGTSQIFDLATNPRQMTSNFVVWNNSLWFGRSGVPTVAEIWDSDGTPTGTGMSAQINLKGSYLEIFKLFAGETHFYFLGRGIAASDWAVWASDGTAEGTVMLKVLVDTDRLVVAGNLAYFVCDNSQNGLLRTSLWRSDGTVAGTIMLKENEGSTFRQPPDSFCAVGDMLYFSTHDNIHGKELWKTDGTPSGTTLVADITGDSGSSNPTDITLVGDSVFFSAVTEEYGRELWSVSIQVPELTISGSGHPMNSGEELPAADSPSNFGASAVENGSVVRSFVLKNAGRGGLTLGSIGIDGPAARDFSVVTPVPAFLAPGQIAAMEVRFHPSAPGLREARISIPNNDGEQNPLTFTVTGSGVGSHTFREAWRLALFGTPANEGDAADSADPDKDGLTNLMEWACLQDPKVAAALPLNLQIVENVFEFHYARNADAIQEGTVFAVEWSDSLSDGSWSSFGVSEEIVSSSDSLQQVKAKVPRENSTRRFVRLRVTELP